MSKKVLIPVAVVIAGAGIIVSTMSSTPSGQPQSTVVKSMDVASSTPTTTSPAPTTTDTTQQTVTTQQTSTTTAPTTTSTSTNTTTTPTPSQPDYGEDPNNAGIYVVFNKTNVMTAAGIPSDQQSSADTLINYLMNWRYQVKGLNADLCNILPLIKMASAGSDYVTNPITQLTYCNQLVQRRFGGWQQALAAYLKSPNQAILN